VARTLSPRPGPGWGACSALPDRIVGFGEGNREGEIERAMGERGRKGKEREKGRERAKGPEGQ